MRITAFEEQPSALRSASDYAEASTGRVDGTSRRSTGQDVVPRKTQSKKSGRWEGERIRKGKRKGEGDGWPC